MNQFVYEKTTADPEAHLSQFEPKSEMLNKKRLDHSTCKTKYSYRKTITDNRFETKRLSNAGSPEYL